ncbi:MAG: transposase [Candidatus Marinimicrobia bacterium]|nr:transposase [Candidatus Neomarinimicrobiota bacterium]
MDKYQNKYRIPSTRLQNWDYRSAGAYFITTNTRNGEYYFGNVVDAKMQLSNIGVIADILWNEIINHKKNVELGDFVVMPNHIHGILILDGNDNADNGDGGDGGRDDACIVSTDTDTDMDTGESINSKNQQTVKISPKSGSVSCIIGSFKSAVSKHAHRLGFEFEWQERFYDHIIRNDKSYIRIANYIINNPQNWGNDKFNKMNQK